MTVPIRAIVMLAVEGQERPVQMTETSRSAALHPDGD